MTAEAFPLAWPNGRPRTPISYREPARFTSTLSRARDDVVAEVQRLVGRYADPKLVISSNLKLRQDGMPLANQRAPEDVGVAVYFVRHGKQMSFACDRWTKVEHNLQAIAKTIDALRGIERWGTGDMVEAAFTGFEALPAPAAACAWRSVLECEHDETLAAVHSRFRRMASEHHPDKGGSPARMAEINAAWAAAQRELS